MTRGVRIYRPGSSSQRTQMSWEDVEKIPLSTNAIAFDTGNGREMISVGDNFPSRAGGRLIVRVRWETGGPAVFYYEQGALYGQKALYFWKDSWMEAFQTGAKWATGGMLLAQIQVEICLGVMAGAGGKVAHWALTAVDVVHAVSELDIPGLIDGIPKLLRARRILKAYAPQVYDKLFSAFMDKLLENIGESLATAATAHFIGRVMGRMGRHVPGQLRDAIKDIAKWAAAFVAIRLISLVGLAANDIKRLAIDMKNELAKLNIQINLADAENMVRELWTHKNELQDAFKLMQGVDPTPPAPAKQPERKERIWTGFKF